MCCVTKCNIYKLKPQYYSPYWLAEHATIWLKLALYLRYLIKDLITPHHWPYIFAISKLYTLRKKTWPFIWMNLNPIFQWMPQAKCGSNWFSGSGEDFKFRQCISLYLPLEKGMVLHLKKLTLLHIRMLCDILTAREDNNPETSGPWATLLACGRFLHVINIILQISYYLPL